jgi:hypothetical protein
MIPIIDQVDESQFLPYLATRLRKALAGRDTSRLCIVLGCRTADYPSKLTEALRSQGRDCVLVDLAPLTREQALRLASSVDQVGGELTPRRKADAESSYIAANRVRR